MVKRSIFAAGFAVIVIAFALWVRGIAPAHFNVPTPKPPPGPNAFNDFARAEQLVRDEEIIDPVPSLSSLMAPRKPAAFSPLSLPSGDTEMQVRKAVADNSPAIGALRAGFSHPYFAPPLQMDQIISAWPDLAQDRSLARLCAFESRAAAQCGDWAGAEQYSLDCIELGTDVTEHGALLHKLVGIACNAIGRRAGFAEVEHLSAPAAAQDAKRLEQLHARFETPVQVFTEERWSQEADLNTLLGSDASAARKYGLSGESGMDAAVAGAKLDLMWMRHPKQEIARNYIRFTDTVMRKIELPYPVAIHTPDPSPPNDPITGMTYLPLNQMLFKEAEDDTFNTLLMTMLALRAYKLDHSGTYPQTLGDLAPRYLSAVPLDPFATSAPLQYRAISGSKAYLLYSVGPDGIDNGGTPMVYKTYPSAASGRRVLGDGDTGDIIAGKDAQ